MITNRILICGGRDFTDEDLMRETCKRFLFPGDTLIHGDAEGADRLAEKCANLMQGIIIKKFPADWKKGTSAGPIRNRKMIKEGKPDLVIALPGGKGTKNMIDLARKHDITVVEINREDNKMLWSFKEITVKIPFGYVGH